MTDKVRNFNSFESFLEREEERLQRALSNFRDLVSEGQLGSMMLDVARGAFAQLTLLHAVKANYEMWKNPAPPDEEQDENDWFVTTDEIPF